ncbi:hypothetical protein BaRGS_00026902 [Batillaria attramentaria]|uniref:Uncharacterized protein n=1 Tax=Batillaria attramentaria TaxID=370345 RepID=A0ABD0K4X2_9CAEN
MSPVFLITGTRACGYDLREASRAVPDPTVLRHGVDASLITSLESMPGANLPVLLDAILSLFTVWNTPKDIDAVESQRLERIQAARRIKRSKSAHSHRSYSVDSRQEEDTSSTCLPNCLRPQARSDRDHLYRSRNDTSVSDFPSPDSNPPSYEGTCQGAEFRTRSWSSSNTKSLPEDCLENRDERTALLVDIGQQGPRYRLLVLSCYYSLSAMTTDID